jgi:hypothetical protein
MLRANLEHLTREGQLLTWGIPATAVLVETLLDRAADGDAVEAAAAIARVVDERHEDELALRDIWLLRMRALLARSQGRFDEYRQLADSYREMSVSLGFEGHVVWAESLA